jgi:hypothetical protein
VDDRGPVQADVDDFRALLRQQDSSGWQRRPGEGIDHRTVTNPGSTVEVAV